MAKKNKLRLNIIKKSGLCFKTKLSQRLQCAIFINKCATLSTGMAPFKKTHNPGNL